MSYIRLVKKGENKLKNITGFGVNQNAVKQMELTAKSSFETLQNYNTKLNNREYMSTDDLKSYESAMNSYIENNNRLRRLNKIFGQGYTAEQEKEWNDAINSLQNGYKETSDYFSRFKDENEYKGTLAMIKQQETMRAEDVEKGMAEVDTILSGENLTALKEKKAILEKGIKLAHRDNGVYLRKYGYNKTTAQKQLAELKKEIAVIEEPAIKRKDYLTQAKYLQNYFYLTENDVSLDELKSHLSDDDPIAYTSPDGKNVTWQKLYDKKKYEETFNALYSEMSAMPDWEEKSKYKPTYNTNKGGRTPFNAGDDDYERANHPNISVNGSQDIYYALQTNEKEKQLFNYLAHNKGTDNAIDWLMSWEDIYKERRSEQNKANAKKLAEELPGISDALAVTSVLVTPFEYVGNIITGNADDRVASADFSSTIKSTRMEQVDWEIGNFDAFDFLYNAGMSMAESTLSMATLGGAGGIALGLSAAGQGVNDALDRGLSSKQAFWNGLASGTFEMIFETISIGQFSALKESLGSGIKNIAKNIGKSMLVNASEETLTEIANIVYDTVMNTDFSDYETKIRAYVTSGMTPEEAEKQVKSDLTRQVAEAAASGLLMGFGFGSIGSVSSHKNAKAVESAYSKADINSLINIGLTAPDSKAYALAQQAQSKTNNGKSLSAQEIVDLQQAVTQAVSDADISKIKQAVEARLIELGEGKAASAVADIIAKQVAGQKLTASEKSTLKNSKYGQRVANEIVPENVASGEYSSEWVKSIGTDIINRNVYNRNLQSTAESVTDSGNDDIAQQGGQGTTSAEVGSVPNNPDRAASGVVKGSDGKQYYADGSGDEYFWDPAGVDVAHDGDSSAQGEVVEGENSKDLQLSEPALKDITRAPTAEESIAAAISNERLDTKQLRISDFVKKHFPEITLKFSGNMTKGGLWDPESKTLLLNTNQTVAGMYIEVLKHEFMHRLESKRLYQEFKQFLFNKDVTFGIWAKVQCKVHGIELTQNATAREAISKLTDYYYNSVKNDMSIAKKYRDAFTTEDAQREMVADFFGEIMFNGKKYRAQVAQALADETFITLFDENERAEFQANSMAALAEIAEYKPNIFQQIVDWVKRIILKLRGTRIKADAILADELERNIKTLEDYVKQVYNSRDTKKAAENGGVEYKAIKRDVNGNTYWQIDSEKDIFKGLKTTAQYERAAREFLIKSRDNKTVIHAIDGKEMSFIRLSAEEFTNSEESKELKSNNPEMFNKKMRLIPSLEDLTLNANVNWQSPDFKNHKLFKERGFENFRGKLCIDNVIFNYIVRAGKAKFGDVFYDINLEVDQILPRTNSASGIEKSTSNNSISNPNEIVNTEKNNDNSSDNPSFAVTAQMQQLRYNPEAYAKYLGRQFGAKNINSEAIGKKIKQMVAQDNKSAKAQEDTRQKVYDREGNLVGELTLKERLINEVAVEIAESIAAPLTAQADEVLSALKEKPLRINEKQEAEIKHQFGTLTNFRRDTGIRVVSESSEIADGLTTLEDAWNGDWVSEYPDLFDSDINDLDMTIRLAEIVDKLNGMTEELDTEAIAADVADNLTKTLNETGPKAEKRRVNEAYRKGVADERAKNEKQISDLQKQNRNLKNRVKPKDVQNIRSELSRIFKKLAANSSTKHVHQGLKKAVSEFLELFNQSDEFTFKPEDRAKVTRLWREYSKLAKTSKESEAYGYDAQIALSIEALEDILPGRSLWDLHPDELAQVKEIIQNVSHCIENVNNMIVDGKAEEIATVANNVRVELGHKKGKIFDLGNADLDMKNTTPVYFFERLGSKTMQKLFGAIKKGESIWARNMLAAREKIAEIKKRYGYDKWKDAILKFTTELGDEIELDLEQAMLLYATVKRERANLSQEAEHTYIGGVVIPTKKIKNLMSDIRGFTKRDGESDISAKKRYKELVETLHKQIDVAPHQIRVSDFAKVSDFLTEQQKAYADEMVAYLSNDMAKLGNEVSMQLFGIEKFNEKYYIPYNSADNFLASMPGVEPTSSIKHRSFTKDLTHGANNPLLLTSFSEVCANHIEQMCMYNAMAIPVDNLTRVLNYTVPGTETSKAISTKDEIERVLGKSGLRYINNLIRDMSGSVRISDMDSIVGKLTGRYKKVAVLASLSVIIQQPTSIIRAFKYIPERYFWKTTFAISERSFKEMKKYVGEAIIKEMGGFDTGVGATNSDYLLKPKRTAGQVIDDVAGWGANKADQITWAHIWAASKSMVAKQNPELRVGSEAFFEKAAEICSETLSKTQVYDSVLVKSEAMRSKSPLSKMMTAFMSEPTVTYNMVTSAVRDIKARKVGALKGAANTAAILMLQIVVNAAVKSLVYAMRDDDEDETYFEKWLSSFVESAASDMNFLNYLPLAKDFVSLMQGYSVERMDMAAVSDIVKAFEKVGNENTTELERLKSLCTAFSLITGVPVKNVWRDTEGAFKTIKSAIEKDYINTPEGAKKAARVGFSEAVDWMPGVEIDTDGSAKLVSELEGNATYDSFGDADKKKVKKGVSGYLKNSEKFEKGELRSKAKQFEDLYAIRRKYGSNSKKYRAERKKLLDSGIEEKDLDLGLEIAKFKFLEQNGITVAEYYAAKTELNRKDGEDKVYDTDGSGGFNTKETKAAIKEMKGFDKNEKNILFDLLKP